MDGGAFPLVLKHGAEYLSRKCPRAPECIPRKMKTRNRSGAFVFLLISSIHCFASQTVFLLRTVFRPGSNVHIGLLPGSMGQGRAGQVLDFSPHPPSPFKLF